jgi:hypothetical protein
VGVGPRRFLGKLVEQLPAHPEVDHENASAREPEEHVLAAPVESVDALPRQVAGEHLRFRVADDARKAEVDRLDGPADEERPEVGRDRLDLR